MGLIDGSLVFPFFYKSEIRGAIGRSRRIIVVPQFFRGATFFSAWPSRVPLGPPLNLDRIGRTFAFIGGIFNCLL